MPAKRDEVERFWEKVQPSTENFYEGTPCQEWQSAQDESGYGRFWAYGQMFPSHRWAWFQRNGELPPEIVIDHLCRNPPCVNVAHLEPVSIGENQRRGVKGWGRGTCQRGHDITDPDNIRTIKSNGERFCHLCRMELQRERRARERELVHV